MSGSVVAVTLYAATLLAFGLGYAVVFFTGSLMLNYKQASKILLESCENLAMFLAQLCRSLSSH